MHHYCPDCKDIYKDPKAAWILGWAGEPGVMQPVPCKKHSLLKTSAKAKCCACSSTQVITVGTRGQFFCSDCWYSPEATSCGAPYCHTQLRPGMEGVVSTPNGMKRYCPDCALVRSKPSVCPKDFHPLSWAYHSKCLCVVCKHLRGKSDKWPNPKSLLLAIIDCSGCGTLVSAKNTVTIDGQGWCHACQHTLKECSACKEPAPPTHFHNYHPSFFPDHMAACDTCLGKVKGLWLCDVGCQRWYAKHEKCNCGGVYGYNYKPPTFNYLSSRDQGVVNRETVPFLGLELEVEAQRPGATRIAGAKIAKKLGSHYSYVVHDGSLLGTKQNGLGGDLGFEIVTHPFTYEWFQDEWPNIEELLTTLSAKGYRSWEGKRCGIHIHISRGPMSDAHAARFIRFVWGSVNMMLCIGQRGYNDKNLNKHSPFHKEDRSRLMEKVRDFINPDISQHYTALSTLSPHTIEARWFRGTLNPVGVRKNVEFMHSLWYFTKIFGNTSANEINYIDWLRSTPQARQYSVLLDFLERNYVTRR